MCDEFPLHNLHSKTQNRARERKGRFGGKNLRTSCERCPWDPEAGIQQAARRLDVNELGKILTRCASNFIPLSRPGFCGPDPLPQHNTPQYDCFLQNRNPYLWLLSQLVAIGLECTIICSVSGQAPGEHRGRRLNLGFGVLELAVSLMMTNGAASLDRLHNPFAVATCQ